MDGKTQIVTMVDATTASTIEIWGGDTRDQIILIREAVHALRTEAASQIKVSVQREKFTLTVEAKK